MGKIVPTRPPIDTDSGMVRYFGILVDKIQSAIDAVGNGILTVKELPEKPKDGRIYYVSSDGFYVNVNNQWHMLSIIQV